MRAAIEQSKPASVILRNYRKDGQMFWNQLWLTVVEVVVKVGRALNADVTAEGVGMASEASSLRGLGCPLGQGFLFSRPLPEKNFWICFELAGRSANPHMQCPARIVGSTGTMRSSNIGRSDGRGLLF